MQKESILRFQKNCKVQAFIASAAFFSAFVPHSAHSQTTANSQDAQATVTVQMGGRGTQISPDLFGIFFEDLNYAADGGLYAELIQNRSFEYSNADRNGWNSLTAWELVQRGAGKGSVSTESAISLHANNPHYASLNVENGGSGVGLRNSGFDGISLKAGEQYNFSCFARRDGKQAMPLAVTLEGKNGAIFGKATFDVVSKDWIKYSAAIQVSATDADARLVIATTGTGTLALDMVSLFPQHTFHNRPNGLRADLAQTIADLKPRFVRFPGGCLAHGDGINNIYHWKNTIGPVERRKAQPNIWRYHQTVGLGYFEYFQFCEDIGAKPLPVVAAGVSCQNSFRQWGVGQQSIPLANMDEYIQDVLDLVEYANGPVTSTWGAKRAASGHPKPFNLQYLGVGNEDHITPEFKERFKMINKAVKAKYPGITVIGTSGPSPSGQDFDEGWKFANKLNVDMVDEHYYMNPDWFLSNLNRYDSYKRSQPKVYLGEYASRGNTLYNALAEAAYMASLERNGDVVHLASYAPLLAKMGNTQWNPDLIYFNNTEILRTPNYYVQQLYGVHAGDTYLPNTVALKFPKQLEQSANVFLGTWNTQAQFDDVRLESGTKALLNETFDASSEKWRADSGNWTVTDGVYSQSGNPEPALSKAISVPVERIGGKLNYTFSLRARKTGGQEGFLIGFGATDDSNFYWWNLGGWNNRSHGIERHRNGASNLVGQTVPGTIEIGRWYDIKIVVNDSRIQCFLDGKLIHDVVDDGKSLGDNLVASSVRDSKTGDIILKLVNVSPVTVKSQVDLNDLRSVQPMASRTILTGTPTAVNSFAQPLHVVPQTTGIAVGKTFSYAAPPHSLSVIRLKTR